MNRVPLVGLYVSHTVDPIEFLNRYREDHQDVLGINSRLAAAEAHNGTIVWVDCSAGDGTVDFVNYYAEFERAADAVACRLVVEPLTMFPEPPNFVVHRAKSG